MPSRAYLRWATVGTAALDEIEAAHRAVGGTGPGRRTATQQINYAYAMLLSAQFQGFCRDLHSECVDFLVGGVCAAAFQSTMRAEFLLNRKLDRGNPNPGNIGADFNRLGLDFRQEVEGLHARNRDRFRQLDELNEWRNAIAHQDFTSPRLAGTTLQLRDVRGWRGTCEALAVSFDEAMRRHLATILGASPW